jgi:tetratricopeptide (TPR) repeat protein
VRQAKFLFFLTLLTPLHPQGLEDWFAVVSEWAGTDPNAGRASFLSLLIPLGGRYQGMATAYTAVLKDSGYLEANPSGSSVLTQTELSLFHHDWIGDSRLEGVVYTMRQGDFGLGGGLKLLYLPFTGINEWGDRYANPGSASFAKGNYTEFVATANVSYNLFSSYYFHGLALGTNLKFAYRGVPEAIYPGQSAVSLLADFGLLTRFNLLKFFPSRQRNFSIGLSARNLGFPVDGEPLPSLLVVGLAYSPIRPLTIATDLQVPFFMDFSPAEQPSVALGMDLVFTDFLSLQSGLHLKKGRPRLTAGITMVLEKMTITASYSLDLLTTLTAFDRINLEVKLNLGDLGRIDREERARELYLKGLEQFAKGNITEAINFLEESVDLNPNFEPARENLELARQAKELQKLMEETQTLPSSP